MVLAGAAHAITSTSANSLLQATASPRLIGQVASLYMLAMRGGFSLGSLLTGVLVDRLGVQPALLLDGMIAVAIHLAIWRVWVRSPLPTKDVAG